MGDGGFWILFVKGYEVGKWEWIRGDGCGGRREI